MIGRIVMAVMGVIIIVIIAMTLGHSDTVHHNLHHTTIIKTTKRISSGSSNGKEPGTTTPQTTTTTTNTIPPGSVTSVPQSLASALESAIPGETPQYCTTTVQGEVNAPAGTTQILLCSLYGSSGWKTAQVDYTDKGIVITQVPFSP